MTLAATVLIALVPNFSANANLYKVDPTNLAWDGDTFSTIGHNCIDICISEDGSFAYATSTSETLRILDLSTGSTTHVIGTSSLVEPGIALSPNGPIVYWCDNFYGVRSWNVGTSTLTNGLITGFSGGGGLVVDATATYLYLVSGDYAYQYDLMTSTLTKTLHVVGSSNLVSVAINAAGTYLYATDHNTNTVYKIDVALASSSALGAVLVAPEKIICDSTDTYAYVVNSTGGTISVIDESTGLVAYIISSGVQIPAGNFAITLSPDGSILYIANDSTGDITAWDTSAQTILFSGSLAVSGITFLLANSVTPVPLSPIVMTP